MDADVKQKKMACRCLAVVFSLSWSISGVATSVDANEVSRGVIVSIGQHHLFIHSRLSRLFLALCSKKLRSRRSQDGGKSSCLFLSCTEPE